jgi:LPXTG-motif cell wall-anchored protein
LAFTGADIGMMVGGGVLLLAAGTGLVLFTRRRAHSA